MDLIGTDSQLVFFRCGINQKLPKASQCLGSVLSSLFCCPSIFAQLRAAVVAAELPLRGKLRAEATPFSIVQRILEIVYQCFRALFVQGLILFCQARIAPCSTHEQNWRRKPRVFCWVRVFDLESGGARCAPSLDPHASTFFDL